MNSVPEPFAPAIRKSRAVRIAVPAAALVLAAAPLALADSYTLFELGRVAAIVVVLLGLNLLTGNTGLISVGHGALMGIGAYLTAIGVAHLGLPYWLAIPAAALLCALLGAALGLPALRIRGLYLALVTLAVAIALTPVLTRLRDITGGPLGISPRLPDLVPGLNGDQSRYAVAFVVAALAFVFTSWLSGSRWGRGFAAVKASDAMAAASGVPVARTKVVVFALSSGLAGLGGGMFMTVIGTITPGSFTVTTSITLLAAAVVGGIASPWGAVLGALFFVYIPDLTSGLGGQIPQIAYVVLLLIAIYFLPGGIASLPTRILRWTRRRRHRNQDDGPPIVPAPATTHHIE